MQYRQFTVNVTRGSRTVTGNGTAFTGNVQPGNAFKVKDNPVIYTVSAVVSDTQLTLSANYSGNSITNTQYQITRDYTPNLELAEVHTGDQDWPVHLTQQTLRRIDALLGHLLSSGAVYACTNATPPPVGTWVFIGQQTIGVETVMYYKRVS